MKWEVPVAQIHSMTLCSQNILRFGRFFIYGRDMGGDMRVKNFWFIRSMRTYWFERKLRHTTHIEGLPSKVTIVREHHPLRGQTLEVYDRMHRNGILLLILVLPDGTRSLIPAAWTDLEPSLSGQCSSVTIGSIPDLLHARKVVDSLLRKLDSSEQITSKEERERATATAPLAQGRPTEHLGKLRLRDPKNGHRHTVEADRQGGSSGTPGGKP
jgi:hypothetical protein